MVPVMQKGKAFLARGCAKAPPTGFVNLRYRKAGRLVVVRLRRSQVKKQARPGP